MFASPSRVAVVTPVLSLWNILFQDSPWRHPPYLHRRALHLWDFHNHRTSPQNCPQRGHPMLNRGWCPKGEPVERRARPISDTGGVAQHPCSAHASFSLSLFLRKTQFLLSRCHEGGEDADREELMRVTTNSLCCHTVVTRAIAIYTLSVGYAQSVTTWRRDNEKITYREKGYIHILCFTVPICSYNKCLGWCNKDVSW